MNSKTKNIIIAVLLVAVIALAVLVIRGNKQDKSENLPDDQGGAKTDESQSFEFNLTSDGRHELSLKPGDSFVVVYKLYRTDADEDFVIYAVQNEIEFDSNVFELSESSIQCRYTSSVHALDNGKTSIYMNTFSASPDGFEYSQGSIFGSFELKVKADAPAGKYTITSNNCKMSTRNGDAVFKHAVSDLFVEVSK